MIKKGGAMDRRTQYLDTAMRLFSRHGFVGTTMDMIITEVGGSKATLYKHFAAKEDLLTGLVDLVAATIGRDLADPGASTLPLADELTAIGRSACRGVWSPESIAVLRLSLGEYGRFPELARTVWDHGPAVTYANFHLFLDERERRGELKVDDKQLAAEQFIAGTVGHIQLKIAFGMTSTPDDAELETRVASAVKAFLARYAVETTAPQ